MIFICPRLEPGDRRRNEAAAGRPTPPRAKAARRAGGVGLIGMLAFQILTMGSLPAAAELYIGAGASLTADGVDITLDCDDLTIAGDLDIDSKASLSLVRDAAILPGASFGGGDGTLEVAGDWRQLGAPVTAPFFVRMLDGCGLNTREIQGSTTFADLEITTTLGSTLLIEAGETITVLDSVRLIGVPQAPLVLRSTMPGVAATLQISPNTVLVEAQAIDVDDVVAPLPIAVDVDSAVGSNAPGWILPEATPALSVLAAAALTGLLLFVSSYALRAERASPPNG